MFAERYIEKNIVFPGFINEQPAKDLGVITVIPCYRETQISATLQSLASCSLPSCKVEIIIVINQSERDNQEVTALNNTTATEIERWKLLQKNKAIKFFVIQPDPFNAKHAGAGMARKTGMDEAIRRFQAIKRGSGIIVSLDADTTVEKNYFIEIEKFYKNNSQCVGATIRFQHQVDASTMSKKQMEGIALYERYLHYYKNALTYTHYPFPIFTIGSAFCCTAEAYVKQGGMNKRQAGEDFYFLHKLSQLGPIGEINSTCVFPSARLSDRVPFGTGPILQRWMDGREDLSLTYNFQAFTDLKIFFEKINELFNTDRDNYNEIINQLSVPLQNFLNETNFFPELQVINQYSSSLTTFAKRFFQVFNAFRILKYINFAHEFYYNKISISEGEKMLANSKHFQ